MTEYTNSTLNDVLAIMERELNTGKYTCPHYTDRGVYPYTYLLFDTVENKFYLGCRRAPIKYWGDELMKRGGYFTSGKCVATFRERPDTIKIMKVMMFFDHQTASDFEENCLKTIGECQTRRKAFYNLRFGGSPDTTGSVGCWRGKKRSKKDRKKMSAAKSGSKHPNFGRTTPPEMKAKLSENNTGDKHPQYKYSGLIELFGGVPRPKQSRLDQATYLYFFRRVRKGTPLADAVQQRLDADLPFEPATRERCIAYLNECRKRRVSGTMVDYIEPEVRI